MGEQRLNLIDAQEDLLMKRNAEDEAYAYQGDHPKEEVIRSS
jgi:hypothetical protein